MAALASLLPSFLKRRKRSDEEEEAREVRATLEAAPHAAVVGKCLELRAANKALSQRVAELERAAGAQGEAAMRAVVRSELARAANKAASDTAGAGGDAALMPAPLQSAETEAEARMRLLALSGDQLLKLRINANAVSIHEPDAQAWLADAKPPLVSPRSGLQNRPILFFNLRPASVHIRWIGYDGNEKMYSPVDPDATLRLTTSGPGHLFRVYDADTQVFLGGVRAIPAEEFGSEQAWMKRELRVLFGFDGFISPSLRSVVDAFTARRHLVAPHVCARDAPKESQQQVFVIV